MKQLARTLRHNQTDAENLLWRHLRNQQLSGFKFRRQYWIENYIVDFVCIKQGIVIELDGGQHASNAILASDKKRTAFLESRGFKVLRFWNNEILANTEGVLEHVLSVLNETTPHPTLSPRRGDGQE